MDESGKTQPDLRVFRLVRLFSVMNYSLDRIGINLDMYHTLIQYEQDRRNEK